MWLCKRDLSKECGGKYRDCTDCVLDKIKAEIAEKYERVPLYDIPCDVGLKMVLETIDKYKLEGSDKE